jgi:hypothetical protein
LIKKLLLLFFIVTAPVLLFAQQQDAGALQKQDTVIIQKDSLVKQVIPDTISKYQLALERFYTENILLNTKGTAVSMIVKPKQTKSKDGFFYLLVGLVLLVGLIKFFFSRYFTMLFRVFFNTSLRQSQLTDQLMQARLPSLFFNLFFIVSGGTYVYFLLLQYQLVNDQHTWILVTSCVILLGIIYLVKFSTLKFTGWVTGYTEATDTYIFVIFLISKIIGVLLLPFTILMAFSELPVADTSAVVSLVIIGFLLLLRFFRSYGLVQNQLKVSRFHFLLYIAGIEIIPLLLIYKGLLFLLSKNL